MTDPRTHRRFLDYLERLSYFVKEGRQVLSLAQFEAADAEQRLLESRGDARDDEEEARYVALNRVLLKD